MTDRKPERTLELQVDIDAPLEAAWKAITEGPGLANWFAPIGEVSAPGAGATVKTGWSEEATMTGLVEAWEPMEHVRWLDQSGWMGPDTALAVDYFLSTENGKTRVRLVQSAFGASDGWDDLFEGTQIGWTYFLYNLRVYLERHAGRVRRMISERLPAPAARAVFWRHLLGAAGGLVVGGAATLEAGDRIELRLGDPGTVRAVVEIIVEGHALGLRVAELSDALLFIELEGKADEFHVGYWLSVYDQAIARDLDSPARRAFRRVHESLEGLKAKEPATS
jgi:uncharacterized protein YndB with AHSA1/START domain